MIIVIDFQCYHIRLTFLFDLFKPALFHCFFPCKEINFEVFNYTKYHYHCLARCNHMHGFWKVLRVSLFNRLQFSSTDFRSCLPVCFCLQVLSIILILFVCVQFCWFLLKKRVMVSSSSCLAMCWASCGSNLFQLFDWKH